MISDKAPLEWCMQESRRTVLCTLSYMLCVAFYPSLSFVSNLSYLFAIGIVSMICNQNGFRIFRIRSSTNLPQWMNLLQIKLPKKKSFNLNNKKEKTFEKESYMLH